MGNACVLARLTSVCLPFLMTQNSLVRQLVRQLLDKWFEESGKTQLLRVVCFSVLPGQKEKKPKIKSLPCPHHRTTQSRSENHVYSTSVNRCD